MKLQQSAKTEDVSNIILKTVINKDDDNDENDSHKMTIK